MFTGYEDFEEERIPDFIRRILHVAFDASNARELAKEWLDKADLTTEERVDGIIFDCIHHAGQIGFVTGLTGPVGLIANIPASILLQVRMVGAVAVNRHII